MRIGIVGLAQSGKTTLFNALTGLDVDTAAYAGQDAVRIGVCKVPDARLDRLEAMFRPKKKTYATVEYVDLAGIAAAEEGRGGISDDLIAKIRPNDMILAVVRAFENDAVPHPAGSVDPARDMEALWTDLLLSDLSIVENRIARLEADRGKPRYTEEHEKELELVRRCKRCLDEERPLREMELTEAEAKRIRGFQLLSRKPLLVAVNVDERDLGGIDEILRPFGKWRAHPRTEVIAVAARSEADLRGLEAEEAAAFREELGLAEPVVERIARASYDLLGYISFFTVGDKEVRAWTIPAGTPARQAAGAIHDDLERGFIRAEVVPYEHLVERGGLAECRKDGSLRLEGKDYLVKDGEIFHVRFSV